MLLFVHTYTHLGFVLRWPVIHLTAPSFHLPPDCWRALTRRPQSAEGPEEGPSILAAACFCLPCWINDAIGWHTHSHTSSRLADLIEWGLVVKRPCIRDVGQFCRPYSSAVRCHRELWRTKPPPSPFLSRSLLLYMLHALFSLGPPCYRCSRFS